MNTATIASTQAALTTLLSELADGVNGGSGYVLNPGDVGLLRSLDRLSAEQASVVNAGGSSIAAHVDHLCYGLSLMNRWGEGEKDPFADSDYSASWERTTVSAPEWAARRAQLRTEIGRWAVAVEKQREMDEAELAAMIGSITHLAYHMGSIRQIDRATRGPSANV